MSSNKTTVEDHFSTKSADWDDLYERPSFKDRLSLFNNAIHQKLPVNSLVLDYGCGTGVLSYSLSETGYKVIGLDVSAGMIDICQNKLETVDQGTPPPEFQHINENSNISKYVNSCDGIVSSSVLEYVKDDTTALRQFNAILKPNGILVFSVPHKGSITAWFEDHILSILKKDRDVSFCQRRYNLKALTQTLQELGFVNIELTHFELPRFGKFGVILSRTKAFGLMTLIIARKP